MEAVRPKPKGKSKKKSPSKHKEKKQHKNTTEIKAATTKVEGATPETHRGSEEVTITSDSEKDGASNVPQKLTSNSDDVVASGMESGGIESQNEIESEVVQKFEANVTIRDGSGGDEVKSKPLPIISEAPKPSLVDFLKTNKSELQKKESTVDENDVFFEASEDLSETLLSKERTSKAVNASNKPTLQQVADPSSKNDVIGATPLNGDAIATTQSAVGRQEETIAPVVDEQVQEVVPTKLTSQIAQVDADVEAKESAPALIDLSEQVCVVQVTAEMEEEHSIHYPQLDSFSYLQEEEVMEDLVPFTEEDLALLYPNPQLDAQPLFVDNFIKHSNQERHELYELLMTYLKAKQMLTNTQKQLDTLQNSYNTHQQLVWDVETRNISSVGKCGDGSKVTHSHSHKFAMFKPEPAVEVGTALKNIRQLLQEELCMHAYSSQLARVHVENYLFQLMHAFPEMMGMAEDAPVTSWVPHCPPGYLDQHTSRLRDSVSVLFMFLRKPVVDKEFSEDCKKWLDILLADLLRVASLVDHQFIFNHLLRCPPGVSKWGTQYLQLLSPLQTRPVLQEQYQSNAPLLGGYSNMSTAGYSHYWGVGLGLHGDWGGPLLDHFVTMLATLLLPIKERESFLSLLNIPASSEQPGYSRGISQQWIFVEDMEEEETPNDHMLLKESDFISFFDQFPFTDLFQYILQISEGGEYSVEWTASHQVLRLIAFCTCLIRLLGAAFSTLKMARYKEFIKQVGRTIRQTVQYVADHWMSYKAYRLQQGDHMAALPIESSRGEPRYSLNRLQLEFDQFVLRATRWILTAHKLGAWQFLADMPYGSVSLKTMWMIFWNIYCKPSSGEVDDITSSQTGSDRSGSNNQPGLENRVCSPTTMEGVQEAMKDGSFKDHFVDRLMKTYTSEAVFLLTTLVNIARARPADSAEERELINTIVLEIFECTEVIEYARDTYSRTGCNLLDTIAIVHPFCISTLLGRVKRVVQIVGENCILLFKQLSLHLWVPESHDIQLVFEWLIDYPLNSNENLLARVILGGLNWGTKSEDGSSELVLPWSLHCSVALKLVDAHSKHLPSQPGGRNFTPAVSGIGKYLDNKFGTSSDQQEYVSWAWDVVMMLKLHPSQVLSQSMQTLNPIHQGMSLSTGQEDTDEGPRLRSHSEQRVALGSQQPSWIQLSPHSDELILPDLTSSSERELTDLRDAVKYEGLLAYYVALCITSIGTDTDHFMASGLSMLTRLLDQGYYLPTLRVLANVTPRFFKHRKILIEDSSFIHVVVAICNADLSNASLRERWTFTSPTPLVTRKMAALIQTQIQSACGPSGVGGEAVLKFWLEILLSCPLWYRESSVLHLLDTLCMASFNEPTWQKFLEDTLLETYRLLDPVQPRKSLLSSVYSSVASIVVHTGGTPSLFNFIPAEECPWLAYRALCAEEKYEDEEGIWRTLLVQLRNNSKASVDSALKKTFTELKMPGVFPAAHLCIYRWAEFSTVLEQTHPLYPLIWQKFFMLYLQRPVIDSSMSERESQGMRFFASSRSLSLRRQLKTSLSTTCKQLQALIAALGSDDDKRSFHSRCLKLYHTLRLWLEEPKLHSSALYLPGLPQQYDAQRLEAVMKPTSKPWMEFFPIWEVKGQLNTLIEEWVHVAAYQKTLPSKAFPPESSPDTAITRIQKRLHKRQSPVPTPKFHYCAPPFVLLSADDLLSSEALINVVHSDFEYLSGQAMSFCTKANALPMLDEQFMSGLPELYTNEPRQFHVKVPCHSRFNSSHQCKLPATIVFRFNEMTTSPKWEQQLKVNRSEYSEMVSGLSTPVSQELCQIVMRIEHSVTELSRLASQSTETIPNIPLQCGIALFYQILQFITPETRQYPPTCQFLTSCLQILGQEFVQRDPMQTTNILDALISQRGKSELLAPLFKPNLCPEQFLHMYSSAAEMAVREGPSIAFSVLTKFNIRFWLQSYDPSMGERAQLLDFIAQGLALGGSIPNSEAEAMVEVYRHHFVQLLEHRFPEQYYDALQLVITGTDNANIVVSSWVDLCRFLGSPEHPEECKLGLQPIGESLNFLSSHFHELRSTSGQSVYSLINKEYVPVISQFINSLCVAMVTKWMEAISMGTAKSEEAISNCWKTLLDVFTPWIVALHNPEGTGTKVLPPCSEAELELMNPVIKEFVDCVSLAHTTITDPNGLTSTMSLLLRYYCSSLAQTDTPPYILNSYHTHFEQLPWRSFLPNLAALDSMMKLKLLDHHPPSCFVFLGRIFPLFDWNTIVAAYCNVNEHGDSSAPVNFHIVFLQLLIMLAAEREVMERDDTGIPEVIAEAQKFQWEYIDAKTYQDILNWQKAHYDCSTILHTGSCLSLSLRLLKAAAGFQSCFTSEDSHYNETWEKRLCYIQGMVELIGSASHIRETHTLGYSDPVTSLFQTVVDVCVNEPAEAGSTNMISLLREILNLLNICSSTGNMSTNITDIMVIILEQLPDVHLITLPLITASCQTIVSHKHMTLVIEHSIESHFKAISKPDSNTLILPPDPAHGYGWKFITAALSLPGESVIEVCKACFEECAGLVLNAMLMQELPQCTSIAQEYRISVKVVQWCIQMKPKQTQEIKMFLLWEKALGLLMRQVRYSGKFSDLIPHFTTLANSMARFSEDKATEGILGAIGLGKKSCYSHQFRLVSRAMAAFIYCQIPVNASHTSQLRVIPNAPGHVKDITRNSHGSVVTGLAITATKQGDQMCSSLESLMTNKHYSHIKDQVSYAVAFVNNPSYCIMSCNELLVYLCTSLYPNYRYLDLLRVLQL